jgi:hypothetical protein
MQENKFYINSFDDFGMTNSGRLVAQTHNIVFLKPSRVISQEEKSLLVSSVLRNEIQCLKSRLQKYKNR